WHADPEHELHDGCGGAVLGAAAAVAHRSRAQLDRHCRPPPRAVLGCLAEIQRRRRQERSDLGFPLMPAKAGIQSKRTGSPLSRGRAEWMRGREKMKRTVLLPAILLAASPSFAEAQTTVRVAWCAKTVS